jgi:type III secretion protein R
VPELFGGSSLSAALGLLALALVPLALVTLTSFAKIAVVFSALRNALGAPDVPSASVITALALALTVFVMAPVTDSISAKLAQAQVSSASLPVVLGAAREPLAAFLSKNAGKAETELFVSLARERGESAQPSDLRVAWASFAITELKRAFQLGFFVFLPFLVLDFVIANVLLALGLHGLTPSAVALPFKLLLFVAVDGLLLLSRALILGYA